MDKKWFGHYPPGVPHTLAEYKDQYSTLVEMLEHSFEKFAECTAVSNMGHSYTYAELGRLSQHVASYLQHTLKLERGSRVAIMLPNVLQFPVMLVGVLRAGMTVVNVNPLYTSRELVHQLNDSGSDTIIVLANFANVLQDALPKTKVKHVIVTELGDMLGGFKGPMVNFVVKHIKRMVPSWTISQAITFDEMLHLGSQKPFEYVDVKAEDVAFLQYTGGTTGVSKGAVLLHSNMIANVMQIVAWVEPVGVEKGTGSVIGALPLYHIFSLTVCCFCFFSYGSECILVTNPRDMGSFVRILRKSTFNFFVGLNTLFNHLAKHKKIHKVDFSHLQLTVSGGMALQSSVATQWHELTGLPIVEGFGLTEASPVVTINPVNIEKFNGSVGVPIPSTDVRIIDAEGNELSVGKKGELCVKGPQVMAGYWQRQEATDKVLDKDGWLHTGDIARMDEEGFFYLVDRQKDMIVVSGFNVYPNEIEEVISTMPGIKEVAVIGVPSERTGEAVKAFIVKDKSPVTEEEVVAYCRERLTGYKIPKQIEFRFDLPKSNVGKILRRELRDEALAA
ncbi:MAG: AMP-binding protein [Coxiellaceae bacterium]|nr:AMP-binding protein [Coxiellaceae bacterium]